MTLSGRRGRPQPWQAGAKQQRILEATAKGFRQKGYDRATWRDIATEAGLWAGSLSDDIRRKEDLLRLIVEQPTGNLHTPLQDLVVAEAPTAEKLGQAVAVHLRASDAH